MRRRNLSSAQGGCLLPCAFVLICAHASAAVVEVPFAKAALWAADELERSKTRSYNPSIAAKVRAANYCLNNLRLALPHEPSKDIADVAAAMSTAIQKPSPFSSTAVVTKVLALIDKFKKDLKETAPSHVKLDVEGLGVGFRSTSAVLPNTEESMARSGSVNVTLANGVEMPLVGFGTWKLHGQNSVEIMKYALSIGYRHIDTAQSYKNEADVGRALAESGIPRQEIFLATKLSNFHPDGAPRLVASAFEQQLKRLRTTYIDLYIIHSMTALETPEEFDELLRSWKILEQFVNDGKIRALGISNCGSDTFKKFIGAVTIQPVYVQNKFSIYSPQHQFAEDTSLMELFEQHEAQMMGYSVINVWPFVLAPLEDPHVIHIAQRVNRTPSQVLHRWALQMGTGVIPRSTRVGHVRENLQLFDFQLDRDAMILLNGIVTLYESHSEKHPGFIADVYNLQRMGKRRDEL